MLLSTKSQWPPQPATSRALRSSLSYDAAGDRIAYAAGRSAVLRGAQPSTAAVSVLIPHARPVTCVSVSPNGRYIATGDNAGMLRVWDISNGENEPALKGEYPIVSGPLAAIAWDGDSARIVAGGEGRERSGHAVLADSGNSVGEISGHSADITAAAVKPSRPLRSVTADADGNVVFHHGAPFKFARSLAQHDKRAVSDVAYAPGGALFATAGTDRKAGIYDGVSGDFQGWLNAQHDGGVLALAWIDANFLATGCTDCNVRVFDAQTRELSATYSLPRALTNQVVGLVATKTELVALTLSGDLVFWPLIVSESESTEPLRSVQGHQAALPPTAVLATQESQILSAASDGFVLSIDFASSSASRLPGGHTGPACALLRSKDEKVYSVGWDRQLRDVFADKKLEVEFVDQPRAAAASVGGLFASVSESALDVVTLEGKSQSLPLERGIAVAVCPDGTRLAVSDGMAIKVLSPALEVLYTIPPVRSDVTALAFSPNGELLAAGDGSGKTTLYKANDGDLVTARWSFQTSRVASIAWHSDGKFAATASADGSIAVYSAERPARHARVQNVHAGGATAVSWSKDEVISAGADGAVRAFVFTQS